MSWDYTATGDPGAVGVGLTWLHPTTGVLKVRNTTNTAWVTVGNIDLVNLGALPLTGGAVSGNITGTTGWAASDAHNFPTGASINSVAVATINDVTSRITALETSIQSLISSAIATYAGSLSFSNSIAFSSGIITPAAWNTVNTLPITSLQYGTTGVYAKESEAKWVVSHKIDYAATGLSGGGDDTWWSFRNAGDSADVDPCSVSSFMSYININGSKSPEPFSYFIMALRAS